MTTLLEYTIALIWILWFAGLMIVTHFLVKRHDLKEFLDGVQNDAD